MWITLPWPRGDGEGNGAEMELEAKEEKIQEGFKSWNGGACLFPMLCLPSPESQKLSDENADAGMTTMFGLAARQLTRRTSRQKTSRHEQGKGKWLALKPGGPRLLDQSQDKRPFRSSFRSRLLVG